MFFIIIVFKNINYVSIFKKFQLGLVLFSILIIKKWVYNLKNLFFLKKIINLSLSNGLVLIHPVCIYITYILYIIGFIFFFSYFKKKNKFIYFFKINFFKIIFISFVALFLGSFWAQQELNWGGWWNWDFVEIIALIFFIASFILYHNNVYKNYNLYKNYFLTLIYYILLFFFLVRVDILNSIHSFNSFLIINNFFKLIFIIFIFILFKFFLIKKNNFIKFKKTKYFNNFYFLLNIINNIFLLIIFINIFYSYNNNIQFIEITKYLKNIFIYLYIIIIINLIKNKYIYIKNILIVVFTNQFSFITFIYLFIVNIIQVKTKLNLFFRINHFFFFLFIYFIIINNNYLYSENLSKLFFKKNDFIYHIVNNNSIYIFNKNNFISNGMNLINYNLLNYFLFEFKFDFLIKFYNDLLLNNFVVNNNKLYILYYLNSFKFYFCTNLYHYIMYIILLNLFYIYIITYLKRIRNIKYSLFFLNKL